MSVDNTKKIFLVWERECFDNYDVAYITESKEEAIRFIEKLTGNKYESDGDNEYYDSWPATIELYIEEREMQKYYKLNV